MKLCEFECKLRASVEGAGCAPWDYPLPGDLAKIAICVESNLTKFEGLMADPRMSDDCDCAPNCEEVHFKAQVMAPYKYSVKGMFILGSYDK